jgi:hypothetical protein
VQTTYQSQLSENQQLMPWRPWYPWLKTTTRGGPQPCRQKSGPIRAGPSLSWRVLSSRRARAYAEDRCPSGF